MPAAPRPHQRAEAKYNVTTDFPRYDLHHAAASGNLGLVEFALSHGQPINSVLNGVLPLHAACAGGSEAVVQYLIDEGADVNATQLPRRYSNDKGSAGWTVGASGSTPLHFAAANGHLSIVKILLVNGAHPDRPDKYGVTPEMVARENGWLDCADLLRRWAGEREGDLPPPAPIDHDLEKYSFDTSVATSGLIPPTSVPRKLLTKHSMDNTLHLSRGSGSSQRLAGIPPTPIEALQNPEASDTLSGLNFTQHVEMSEASDLDAPRRPSLPHIRMEPASPFHRRTSGHGRRPRSAGNGAINQHSGDSSEPKRLGTKRSLLGMFKKAHGDPTYSAPNLTEFRTISSTPQLQERVIASGATFSPLVVPDTLASSYTSPPSSPSSFSPAKGIQINSNSIPNSVGHTRDHHVLHHSISAVELHHRYSRSKLSDSSMALQEVEERNGRPSQKCRLLRCTRSSSRSRSRASEHSPEPHSGSTISYVAMARTRTGLSESGSGHLSPSRLRVARSVNSLKLNNIPPTNHETIGSAPPGVTEFTVPVSSTAQNSFGSVARSRGFSDASIQSSMSPRVDTPDSTTSNSDGRGRYGIGLSTPSTAPRLMSFHERREVLRPTVGVDARGRGHSISSAGTNNSSAPLSQTSSISTELTFDSPSMHTDTSLVSPLTSSIPTLECDVRSEHTAAQDCNDDVIVSPSTDSSSDELPSHNPNHTFAGGENALRMCVREVSTHAEAKELLAKAQRSVYESVDNSEGTEIPLFQKLTALGEAIALERRFAQGEKQQGRSMIDSDVDREPEDFPGALPPKLRRHESGRSRRTRETGNDVTPVRLRSKPQTVPRATKMRRPHTSEGTTSRRFGFPLDGRVASDNISSTARRIHHSQSHSTSATYPSKPTPLDDVAQEEFISNICDLSLQSPSLALERTGSTIEKDGGNEASPSFAILDSDDIDDVTDPELTRPRAGSLEVPLARVATIPAIDVPLPIQRIDAASRRTGSASKLARMGFTVDKPSLPSTPPSSRSPSKGRFGIRAWFKGK